MAPLPQDPVVVQDTKPGLEDDKIVISGMSGLYAKAKNIKELEDILYEKKNPITDEYCRWKFNHPEAYNHTGKAPSLDCFDAQFFKVHFRLGNSMDSMSRKLLEQAYQAIYDAGVPPEELSGKKVGVFTGSCASESEKIGFYVNGSKHGLGITGCNKSMFANRISYWLNAKGPSINIDQDSCSSMAALELAYQAISKGDCEAAVVGGAFISLHPQTIVHYGRAIDLAADGKTKSFDQNADGTAISDAINVLFLQKAKDAKRVYAEVVHVKTEYTGMLHGETGPQYSFYRDPISLVKFMKDFYKAAKVPPQAVDYVEAVGSASPEADKVELEVIEQVFCKNRSNPLLVGSVMSNIGFVGSASGNSAVTKVLLGYHKGEMAANLHCENPRQDVAGIRDGRIQIVTDHTPFSRGLTAVSQISITGCTTQLLLDGHYKPKDLNRYKAAIPRIVTISGREENAVKRILNDLKSRPIDPEEHALFHSIHQARISGHLGRGCIILALLWQPMQSGNLRTYNLMKGLLGLGPVIMEIIGGFCPTVVVFHEKHTDDEGKTVCLSETVSYFDDAKRPLWFVYSGMGSQWPGMGTQLMRIPIFAAAIERCRKALEPKGIDIVHIITSTDKTIFANILHSFVGIAAVQIGLTDVLTSLGIKPDKIIGHSVGELGCAYADGCFTAEEMILSAYSRGLVSIQTPFIRGSMAAVGIGFHQVSQLVPPEIEIACHNGPESSTISGPAENMKEFVAQLTAQGIFAKEVPCSNIAYHSKYIAEAGPGLLKYLSEVIKNPKPRSDRWVSSSVPQDEWDQPAAKYSSAHYHTNNLLSPVLFEETSRLIPENAVCIEIAPHALLQAILKRSLPVSVKNIPLTRRGHTDNALMVLEGIGKLYMEGFNPKVQNLYPKVEFPVSSSTPFLSHLVEWVHNEKWTLPLHQSTCRKEAAICNYSICVEDDDYSFMQGHILRGKNLYPYAAALVAAWDSLAMSMNKKRKSISVDFRDVEFFGQPTLHENRALKITVQLHRGNGVFEILNEDCKVATGQMTTNVAEATRFYEMPYELSEELELAEKDVYEMFHENDYFYLGDFRSIKKSNKSLTEAEISWSDNWVTYIDGILQLLTLRESHDTVSQLHQIRKINIDINEHHKATNIAKEKETQVIPAKVFETFDLTRCGGVLMENVKFNNLPPLDEEPISLKISNFIPRFEPNIETVSAIQVYLQTVAENMNKNTLTAIGILNSKEELPVSESLKAVFNDIPGVTVNYKQVRRDQILVMKDQFLADVDLVLVQNLTKDDNLCQILNSVLRCDSFIINGKENSEERIFPSTLFRVVSSHTSDNKRLDLIKWKPTPVSVATSTVVTCRKPSELVLLKVTRDQLSEKHKLVILASYPPVAGLKDLVKHWRSESARNQIYLVMVSEVDSLDQLPELDLAYNALVNGVWGSDYYVSYHERVTSAERVVTLRSSRIGDLKALNWVETGEPTESGVAVNVHYTAISNKDVKKALGLFPKTEDQELAFCMDVSGITDRGERVMGLVASGAASSRVKVRPDLLWPVPSHWSLEDAATVPSAYALAFYCFDMKVQFRRGYTVLVHGATGALGQAAIAIALAHGCEVFATVSDMKKKKFLLNLFPALKEDHIGNSRDISFGDMVLEVTKNEGCNVVICNTKDEQKSVSFDCLSNCGILLDTEQLPSQASYAFRMSYLAKERNYTLIDFPSIIQNNDIEAIKKIQVLISEGIARGYVRPLTRVTYTPDEVPRAFRLLAGSRHRGRVVIKLQDKVSAVEHRIICSSDLTQVVLCDGQSFGLQVCQRLVERGARKLCLHCANPSKILQLRVQSWEEQEIKVKVLSDDLSSNKAINSLLSESNALGPVESIYVIVTDASVKNNDKLTTAVASLDLASRKSCPSIRYFVIVNAGVNVGQQTCLARKRDRLPVTLLNIPALRKPESINQTAENAISWRGALGVLERAVCSSQETLTAHPLQPAKPTLLQQIAAIAEIEISEDTPDHTVLLDLGVDMDKVQIIASYLKNKYNIVLIGDGVADLTVQKIRELDERVNNPVTPDLQGLEIFYNYVDPDEILATTEITFLPTLTQSVHKNDNEFDATQNCLYIIPGLEGHHSRFQHICERLKLSAVILQPGLDYLHESPKELAERYAKLLVGKIKIPNNFYLLGYENGVSIALEVAGILEDYGLTGTVFCVGNTPAEFQEVIEQVLSDIHSDEELQNAVVRHMYRLMAGNDEGLEKVLLASTWKEKTEACVRKLLGTVVHSAQYARNQIDAAYTRLKHARSYKVQPRELKSKIILLHAATPGSKVSPAAELQRYSQQPVEIYNLKESLANAYKDLQCSSIINRHLSSDILTAYEDRNLCETYLLQTVRFTVHVPEE